MGMPYCGHGARGYHEAVNLQQPRSAPPVPGEIPEAEWSEVKALPPPAGILPATDDATLFETLFGIG